MCDTRMLETRIAWMVRNTTADPGKVLWLGREPDTKNPKYPFQFFHGSFEKATVFNFRMEAEAGMNAAKGDELIEAEVSVPCEAMQTKERDPEAARKFTQTQAVHHHHSHA